MYTKLSVRRYQLTLNFTQQVLLSPAIILGLGVRNIFTEIMKRNCATVINTKDEDLGFLPEIIKKQKVNVVATFEFFKHLITPFNLLRE